MLTGAFLLVACLGVGVVAFWMMSNDTVAPDEPTHGLLAMPDPDRDSARRPAALEGRTRGGEAPRTRR